MGNPGSVGTCRLEQEQQAPRGRDLHERQLSDTSGHQTSGRSAFQAYFSQGTSEPTSVGATLSVQYALPSYHICSVSDDQQALIWDLKKLQPEIKAPLLEYSAGGEISNLAWGIQESDWIALSFNQQLQILRVY